MSISKPKHTILGMHYAGNGVWLRTIHRPPAPNHGEAIEKLRSQLAELSDKFESLQNKKAAKPKSEVPNVLPAEPTI